jgi:hypothetical protein
MSVLRAYDETMGHAGVIARHANGALEAVRPAQRGGAAGFKMTVEDSSAPAQNI